MGTETRRVGDGAAPWEADELKVDDVFVFGGVEYTVFALVPWEGSVFVCTTFGRYGNQAYFQMLPSDTVEVKAR